jgi:hypothetical protein
VGIAITARSFSSLTAWSAKRMLLVRSTRSSIGLVSAVVIAASAAQFASAAETISQGAFDRCQTIPDEKARLHCFENLTSQSSPAWPASPQAAPFGSPSALDSPSLGPQAAPTSLPLSGKWRLFRTPNPRDGQDVISVMTTAELSGSDPDFAGLDIRCLGQDFEILVFLIRPLPPRARPLVEIGGKKFQGSVVSPGTAILLPLDATAFAKEQWRSLSSLSINVDDVDKKTHGTISLEGFNAALQTLVGKCLVR